jgi:hypothetical protein
MFQRVVGFEVQVLRLIFGGTRFLTSRNERWAATDTQHVMFLCQFVLLWGLCRSCVKKTHTASKLTTHL